MVLRRLLVPAAAAPLVILAACGLFAPPGGYSAGDDTAATDGGGSDAPGTNDVAQADGAPPPSSPDGTIVIVAGKRDPTSPADDPAWTSDVWIGDLDAAGHVAAWRVVPSASVAGPYDAVTASGGSLFTLSFGLGIGGGRGSALQSIGWGPGPTGTWHANAANMPGGLTDAARAFFGTQVVTVGGSRDVPVDGGTQTIYTKEVHVAAIDVAQTQLGAFGDPGISLLNSRSRAGVFSTGDHVYVAGGRSFAGLLASVESAEVDASMGSIGAFVNQPPLMNGGAEHKVYFPAMTATGGFLYVAGGRINNGATPTDVALVAPLSGDTVGAWKNVTALPKALRDHAIVGRGTKMYVIGGEIVVGSTTTRSDEVYSASIAPDGTLGAWETSANAKLPAARSGIVAIAY
jgi:hypothetical protein